MRTYSVLFLLFSVAALGAEAIASPGDLPDHVPLAPGQSPAGAIVLSTSAAHGPAGVLVFGAGPGTVRAASAKVASMASPPGLLEGTRFARANSTRAQAADAPWVLEADAHLAADARHGSAEVVIFDLSEDPRAIQNHTAMSISAVELPASANVTTRLVLSPNDGYVAGRTYDVQIVQRLAGVHRVVAQGSVVLE
jgi:hypothetical protein